MMTYKELMNKVFEIKERSNAKDKEIIEKLMSQHTKILLDLKYYQKKQEEYGIIYKRIEQLQNENEELEDENQKLYNKLTKYKLALYKVQKAYKISEEIDKIINN